MVGLPTSIQKLNRLKVLYLDGNKLTELPVEIGDLKELWFLSVTNNQLVGLPSSIQKLNRLRELYLDENKLTELPAEIGDLTELWQLTVSNNQLVGLPTSIQKLNWLRELYLDGNKLTELPAEIGDLKELWQNKGAVSWKWPILFSVSFGLHLSLSKKVYDRLTQHRHPLAGAYINYILCSWQHSFAIIMYFSK